MKFKRINDKTINCIITPEDLKLGGIELRDLFERKEEALKFLQSFIVSAAASEKFDLSGNYTNMRIAVMQDHTISLTLSESADAMPDLMEALGISADQQAGGKAKKADNAGKKPESKSRDRRKQPELPEDSNDRQVEIRSDTAGENGIPQEQKEYRTEYGIIFRSLHDVIRGCRNVQAGGGYRSQLFRNRYGEEYFLLLEKTGSSDIRFDKMALSLSEFGQMLDAWTDIAYIKEHETCILQERAVETLAALKA